MRNIALFSNHFSRASGTGISRYAHGLVKAMAELDPDYKLFPVATWSNRNKDDLDALMVETNLRLLPTGRWLSPFLWLTVGLPKLEQLLNFSSDLVHMCDLGYLVATSKPFVVTVHDLGSLLYPEYFRNNSNWIMERGLRYAMKKADAFICVSQATADSLLEYVQAHYSMDLSQKIYVSHEGVSEIFFQESDDPAFDSSKGFDFLKQPFILAVGKLSPRKNLDLVIRALHTLKSLLPHHLVMVGGDGWDSQGVKDLVDSLELAERIHFLGYVSDETLNILYRRATLFVYPSLFEGFGLPILEAMAAGCPVITSNVSSLPEVAGDAALLVDPHKLSDVVSGIEAICTNPSLANDLKQKGEERANLFSWKKCARKTLDVYKTVLH